MTLIIDDEEVELPAPENEIIDEDYYDAYALEEEYSTEGTIIEQADNFTAEETLDQGNTESSTNSNTDLE